MTGSPADPVGEGDVVRGNAVDDEKGVGEGVAGSPEDPEGEGDVVRGSVALGEKGVGERVGGRVDWVSIRTAAKSLPPICEPFHPPLASPAIINRPVLSAATALSESSPSVPS